MNQQDIQTQQALLSAIINSSGDAIISKSLAGIITSWNRGAERLFGYTEKDVTGKHISILIPTELLSEEVHIISKITKGELIEHYETQRVKKNGERVFISLTISPIKDAAGKIIGASKIARDVSDRKNIEERLAESENKYRYLFEHNPMPMWIINKQTFQFLDVNGAAIIHYGYSREEFLSMTALDIRPEEDKEKFIRIDRVTTMGAHSTGVWHHKKKDGSLIDVEVSVEEIMFNDVIARLILSNDITAKVKAEQEINLLNETLEQKVIERTAQLEIMNKEMESFSYSVSHDLRAPLRAINGYSQMLEEDYKNVIDEKGKKLLERIQASGKKMNTLIDDLLAFSKLGRKEVAKLEVDMVKLTNEVLVEINKSTQHTATISIGELDTVLADYTLMYQVIMNLICNAIKYSSKKEKPVVAITSEKKDKQVIYRIEDNGAGFDMAYSQKLFGVFQRMHKQSEFEGTGVGLAIVEKIVTKHGGKVWADAAVDIGATFYFSLPA